MCRSLWVSLILLFASLSLAAKEANWLKVRSEHFEIYSAENEKKARKVLEHLERVRKAYELLTKVTIKSEEPVRVLLFRNEKEYREYALGTRSLAYYMSARGRDYIVLSDFDTRTETVLNHEYFHLFSQHAGFRFPVWLEEGLADFYSTLQISSKDVSLGLPVVHHLQFLNSFQGKPMPLAQITAINRQNRHDSDEDVTLRLYAQGWALAHMTFQGKEMRARSQMFFEKIVGGETDTATAYMAVYGLTLERLDGLLDRYIQQRTYYYGKSDVQGLDFTAAAEAVPIEDWETPLLLADMLSYTRKHDQAQARYAALAAQFPERPEIEESRGYLAWQLGDRDTAVTHFRAAAQKKSRNSMLYYQLAALGCNYSAANEDCRNWINESLRLNPANKQARDWAVGYAMNTRDFAGAVALLVRGGQVKSSEAPEFFFKLAYAQYQLEDFREARSAVKRGLQFATKPEDKLRLSDLERHIGTAEQYHAQLKEARAGSTPPPPLETASTAAPEQSEESRPVLARRVAQGVPKESVGPSPADFAVQQFIQQDGATMSAAMLDAIDCSTPKPAVLAKAKGVTLRLSIDMAHAVVVIRNGEVVIDHEFVCGKQKPASLLVGYLKEGAPSGADGLLRILSFQ